MGAVFNPKDITSVQRKIIENALKDLAPDSNAITDDTINKLLNSLEKGRSQEQLAEILGPNKFAKFVERVTERETNLMSSHEQKRLKNMFKESLTFD